MTEPTAAPGVRRLPDGYGQPDGHGLSNGHGQADGHGRPAVYRAQVRWSDPDTLGHVNHARYLSYFEDARMDLLARSPTGLPGSGDDRGCIAARVAVDYRDQVRFSPGLTLRIDTRVARIGNSSWTLVHEMYDGDRHVASSECVLVAFAYGEGRPRPLAADEREFWGRYQP